MNRLTPIKESMHHVSGYPTTLTLYKSAASRYYWVRCYFNGKYKIKTTKTESLKDAKKFATQFYKDTLLSSVITKSSDHRKQFAVVGQLFFKSTEKNSNTSTYKSDYNRYTQHILNEFNQQEIDTITNAQISQFIDKLLNTGIKPATVKHHTIVLRKIMRFAIANDLMTNLPVFPRITGKLQTSLKRDYFTTTEYDDLVKKSEKLAASNVVVQGVPLTLEMKYLIQFMVNSFIRPSDLRVLKHKHIVQKKDGDSSWLELNHPATKTNANAVQAMPVSVFIYEKLIEFKNESNQSPKLSDFVFFPDYKDRDKAMSVIAKQFKRIVAETKIAEKTDKNPTLYSLRHTSIMMRLINGNVNTLALARNARTSQAMIDKFYAAHLTTNQVRQQLHGFTEKTTPEKKSAKKTTGTASKSTRTSSKSVQQ